ncbi:MAG: hypothetical protein QXD69_04360 [Candidatus Bathyarchaeia archaeon]
MFRAIWQPSWHLSLPDALVNVERRAMELGVHVGWIRFPTDGNRVQVFDSRCDRICKVVKRPVPYINISEELRVRSGTAGLAPDILQLSSDELAFVEEWIPGHSAPFSLEVLIGVVPKLQGSLYACEYVEPSQYVNMLNRYTELTEQERRVLNRALSILPTSLLMISQVHGDLVSQNVWHYPQKGLVLLDWEYTRKCLVTYDCWLYLYDYYRRADDKKSFQGEFLSLLGQVFRQLGLDMETRQVLALHMLHLVERNVFLRYASPETTVLVRQAMERDMNTALFGHDNRSASE